MLKEIKNGDLYYYGYNLKDLAKKYGTPLKITFLDIIKDRVTILKDAYDKAIKELDYKGKFIYLNANKANYSKEEIFESFKYNDGLETSSYYDLLLTHRLFRDHDDLSHKYLVCNGYKLNDYMDEIVNCYEEGIHIINILDSMEEYEYFKSLNLPINVGLRIHLQSQYSGDEIENDRFGLMEDEINYILNDIKNTKLVLTTIHFHQRGFDYEDDKFKINFNKGLEWYCKAAKLYNTVEYFDMGGGTPLPNSDDFDYEKWAKDVIKILKDFSVQNSIKEPHLISENGKYSQKDALVNIYKVVAKKHTDQYTWNIVNGSLLIALPEMYALGEPIEVKPINDLDKPFVKSKLAGITCDCDDVLFDHKKGYVELPDSIDLYIACLGTGSYQNSMNGKGGVHHCLLPEEKDIVISNEKVTIRHELQTIEDIYKLLKF